MKRTKKFFINGIILTFTGFFMKSIGMLFGLYVSNKIGSEALGVFNLVMSVYMFAITLACSGLNIACTYLVSEQFENGNYSNGLRAVKSCTIFSLIFGLISSCIIILFSNIISNNWLKSMVSPTPLYLIAVGLPFISISSSINGYFSAIRKAYKNAICQVLELIIKIIISIFLLNVYAKKSVESICICLVLGDVISEVCSCFLLFVLYNIENINIVKNISPKINFGKKIFKITFPISTTSYIRSALSTLKQFLIPAKLVLFGLPYNIALSEFGKIDGMTMSVLLFPNVFFASFSSLLVPEFTSLMVKNYKKRILEICQKVFGSISIFSIFVIIIFYIFSNHICFLVFKNLECAKYIKILCPIILFMYLDNNIDSMLKGLNKQFEVMFCNILDLILTIAIIYFLLPKLGLKGYLFSILISEIFNFIISYFQLHKSTGFKMSTFTFVNCILLILVSICHIIFM